MYGIGQCGNACTETRSAVWHGAEICGAIIHGTEKNVQHRKELRGDVAQTNIIASHDR